MCACRWLVYRTLANLSLNFPNDVREICKRFSLLTRTRVREGHARRVECLAVALFKVV